MYDLFKIKQTIWLRENKKMIIFNWLIKNPFVLSSMMLVLTFTASIANAYIVPTGNQCSTACNTGCVDVMKLKGWSGMNYTYNYSSGTCTCTCTEAVSGSTIVTLSCTSSQANGSGTTTCSHQ